MSVENDIKRMYAQMLAMSEPLAYIVLDHSTSSIVGGP